MALKGKPQGRHDQAGDQAFVQAYALHQAGRLDQAEVLYRGVLARDARHTDALNLLAAIHLQKGDLEQFVLLSGRSLEIQPQQPYPLNNRGNALQQLGRHAEALTSFEQAIALRPDFATAHYNRGNALRSLRRYDEALHSLDRALALKPDWADARANRGHVLFRLERYTEALADLDQAIALGPDHVDALTDRGDVLRRLQRHGDAAASYRRALELAPDNAHIANKIGMLYFEQWQLHKALDWFEQALRLKPTFPQAEMNAGSVLQAMQRLDDAIARYDRALLVRPHWADAEFNKSLVLLAQGRYAEAWALHESGLGPGGRRQVPQSRIRRWDGRSFPGQTLLIRGEQGLGDILQFVRYAALCKERGGRVAVQCPQTLARLLSHCSCIDEVLTEHADEGFDWQIEMLSLPQLFGTTLDTIPAGVPYLRSSAEARARWAPRFAGVTAPKVGLVWSGSPQLQLRDIGRVDKRRSIGLQQLLPLLAMEQIRFYSLQLGEPAQQIDELGLRGRLVDLGDGIEDFLDTAAAIENLDLVIAVDTSICHAAGALAKPVWVLSRFDACWRWLQNREASPWYPSARIFGQTEAGEWNPVIERVRRALELEFADKAGAAAP